MFQKLKLVVLFSICFLFISKSIFSQEHMMAEGNMQFGVQVGFSNNYKRIMNSQLNNDYLLDNYESNLEYDIKALPPINLVFEYASNDYTAIGASIEYFSFKFNDAYKLHDTISKSFKSNGSQLAFKARLVRYFRASPKLNLYGFLNGGIKFASITMSESLDEMEKSSFSYGAYFQLKRNTVFPVVFEVGLGAKFLVTNKIGLSLEAGTFNGNLSAGIFYNLKHKDRRINDKYGW